MGGRSQERAMLLRLMMLFSVLGLMVGPNAGLGDAVDSAEERKVGGEGFGRVVGFVAFVGVILFAIILILALMSLFDVFVDDLRDPEV
jgi:hypothetical protein